MSDLEVTPDYLEKLATIQEQTSADTGSAAGVATGISTDLWVTHGVISGHSTTAVANAERARRSVVEAMQVFSHELAVKLGAAADAYASTDEHAGENIDEQVLA